jgi:nitroreductase
VTAVDLVDTLRTTGAVREFADEPVGDDALRRILDTARFAPSGGNRQAWHVVVVRDPETRRQVRDLYTAGWYEYLAQAQAGLTPFAALADEAAEAKAMEHAGAVAEAAAAGPGGFAEHLDTVPVMLVLLADLRRLAALDKRLDRYTLVGGASVYPFAWSILLAARGEGLGGVITSMPIAREPQLKALLDVPDEFAVAAVIALGKPVHQARRLRRTPVDEFATVDRFSGETFRA